MARRVLGIPRMTSCSTRILGTAPLVLVLLLSGKAGAAGLTTARPAVSVSASSRVKTASRLLGKPGLRPTGRKGSAILTAHQVGNGELGRDGLHLAGIRPDGKTNYTRAHILKKARILREAGFTSVEIQKLMDHGVVGAAGGHWDLNLPIIGGLLAGIVAQDAGIGLIFGVALAVLTFPR